MSKNSTKFTIAISFFFMILGQVFAENSKNISNFSKRDDNGRVTFKYQNDDILSNNFNKLNNSFEYEQFLNVNRDWYFSINKLNGMPIRAFGKPIKIVGFDQINNENIQDASLSFIKSNLKFFNVNINNLKFIRSDKIDNKWYVTYRQLYKNLEVFNSEIELRISNDAKVFSFGTSYYNNIERSIDLSKLNNLDKSNIIQSATTGLEEFGQLSPQITSNDFKEMLMPVPTKNGYEFKIVYEVPFTLDDKIYSFISFVNKENSELLYRHTIHTNVNSSIQNKGTIKMRNPSEPDTLVYFSDMNMTLGTSTVTTNNQGKIVKDISETTTFTSKFIGPWVKVTRRDNKTASSIGNLTPGQNLVINWNDTISMKGERTLFYHANYIHDYYKKLDPNFVGMDLVLDLQIDFTGSPNAFSSGQMIRFIGCQNPAYKLYESSSVLYHEWGHSVNYFLYKSKGSSSGMINASANEACADITACIMLDDNWVGRGVVPADQSFKIRNLKNTYIYPDSVVGESHHDGQILAGAFWDLREKTSPDFVMKLSHKAKYGIPDDMNVGITYSEWFLETLIADDDDNDLTNGTPYFEQIIESFNNHKIGTNLYNTLNFKHTPLLDTKDTVKPYKVDFELSYMNIPNGKPSPIKLIYIVNNEKMLNEVDAIEVSKGVFTAEIPAKPYGTSIKYYFTAYDKWSATNLILSSNVITKKPFMFLVGYQEAFVDDFETSENWILGDATDYATRGMWEVATPNPINVNGLGIIQPGTGTGVNGTKCLVTGALGTNTTYSTYMPNGKTTIKSKAFDFSNLKSPIVKFNKWFYNYYYYNTIPSFNFHVSQDSGSTWKLVELSTKQTNQWESQTFLLSDYINKFDKVRFKFTVDIVKSQFVAWVTEALVDEFKVLSPMESITDVVEMNDLEWIDISPNPANGKIKMFYWQKYLGNGGPIDITLYASSANQEVTKIIGYDLSGNIILEQNSLDFTGEINTNYKGMIIFEIHTKNNKVFSKKIINN